MNANFEISRRSFLKGAGAVGAAGLLAACGGSSSSTGSTATSGAASAPAASNGGAPLTEYYTWETNTRELEEWSVLHSQDAADFNVLTNLVDGLLSSDPYGAPVAAIAESWEHNEDASVWTFHLRDDVDWVDVNGNVMGHITSKDFLVGSEWVINQFKNQAFNTSMPLQTVLNAEEYYNHTRIPAPTSTPLQVMSASTPLPRTSSASWASTASVTPPTWRCGTAART